MKKQRILSALLALCIVFSLVPTALAEKADDFTDVSRSDWYYQFVDYVTSKGYFNGVADKTFAPADNMTRAMFVTVLFRFDGAKGDRTQSAFTDVAPGEWYTDAINWAAANRIVDGVGDGKFAPNDPITRAQMCTMIERYLTLYKKAWRVTLPETGSVSVMVDENAIPAYALAAVKQCQRHGLVNGFEDGTFRPNELSTRAQVAAVIYRMSYLVQNAKPDNTPSVPGGTVTPPVVPPVTPPVTNYTYTLSYDANGGTMSTLLPSVLVTPNIICSFIVTSVVPTREGYTFLGWSTDRNATTATYTAGTTVTLTATASVATLYAVWQKNASAVDPEDLIGKAVFKSVDQVNGKFDAMKKAVVDAVDQVNKDNNYLTHDQLLKVKDAVKAMVKIDDVTLEIPSDDMAPRQVTWNVALNVKEDQAVSVIEQANKIADAIITGNTSKPTPDDIDGFLTSVKNAVESKTGIVLTDKTLSAIKTQVVDKLKNEGKDLWVNFHDGKGNYVCGDVKVDFNGKTYATIKVGDGNTTLEGSKSQIAKELGTAISKEIYKQMKKQGDKQYTSQLAFTIGVNMNFGSSANSEIAAKTAKYANDYQVTVVANLDSDRLLEYKYDEGNYLRLNITQDIQTAYNKGVKQIADQITYNDGTKDDVVAEVNAEMQKKIPTLYNEVKTALDKYDIKLTNTTVESIYNALMPKVESWVDTNWGKITDSATGGGTLTGLDNTALINAVWPLIDSDINALDVDALIQNQISKKLTEKGIDEDWIVTKAKSNPMLSNAKVFLSRPGATIVPKGITLDIQSVEDINAIIRADDIKVLINDKEVMNFKGFLIKDEIFNTASEELDTALNSSATLKDLLAKNPSLKNYLIYSALVKMNLDFKAEMAKAKNAVDMGSLKTTIKTEGQTKLAEKLEAKLATINVSDILNNGSAEQTKYQEKINLINSLKFDAANGIQTKTAAQLAAELKGDIMKDIVGSKGDKYVAQYLGKIVANAQNLLPDGATVTIAGVTLTKSDLTALGNAKTSLDAVTELANLIERFNDFADPAGQKVTVNYNGRTASANLIINVA